MITRLAKDAGHEHNDDNSHPSNILPQLLEILLLQSHMMSDVHSSSTPSLQLFRVFNTLCTDRSVYLQLNKAEGAHLSYGTPEVPASGLQRPCDTVAVSASPQKHMSRDEKPIPALTSTSNISENEALCFNAQSSMPRRRSQNVPLLHAPSHQPL